MAMTYMDKKVHDLRVRTDLRAWGNDLRLLGCVRMREPECPKHFLVKSCVCLVLRKWDHEYMTEVKTELGRVMDIFDLKTGLNYEIQMKGEKSGYADGDIVVDTVIIPADKCPDDFLGALVWLERYLT